MANCVICEKRIFPGEGISISKVNGKICDRCFEPFENLKKYANENPDAEPYLHYLMSFLDMDIALEVKGYICDCINEHQQNMYNDLPSEILTTSNFQLISGFPGWKEGFWTVCANLFEDHITFRRLVDKDSPIVKLPVSQIIETEFMSDKEIIEKSKSVVGRAGVGLLFGPLGAIVGGMSGIGSKQQVKYHHFWLIHYINKDGQEALITLGCECFGCHDVRFNNALKKLIKPQSETTDKVTIL